MRQLCQLCKALRVTSLANEPEYESSARAARKRWQKHFTDELAYLELCLTVCQRSVLPYQSLAVAARLEPHAVHAKRVDEFSALACRRRVHSQAGTTRAALAEHISWAWEAEIARSVLTLGGHERAPALDPNLLSVATRIFAEKAQDAAKSATSPTVH